MGGYESKEYDRLKRRGFKPYSQGHQNMYNLAIEQIGKPSRIFEAGFGIGFGIQKMLEAGVVKSYSGCEPNTASFLYVQNELKLASEVAPFVTLYQDVFDTVMAEGLTAHGRFDDAFCIEVIEHVPMTQHLQFLIDLRRMAPRLWFSSPDKDKSKEGVRTTREWKTLLKQAKFDVVKVDQSNWTYLYICK